MGSVNSSLKNKKQKPGQKISKASIQEMSKLGLFDGHKISFEDALKRSLDFCKENKEFKKWIEKKKKE